MATKKGEQDCCVVTIGFVRVLIPANDGLKLVSLLRNAREVEHGDFVRHELTYLVGERPRCELEMVTAKQLRPKLDDEPRQARRRAPLLLGNDRDD